MSNGPLGLLLVQPNKPSSMQKSAQNSQGKTAFQKSTTNASKPSTSNVQQQQQVSSKSNISIDEQPSDEPMGSTISDEDSSNLSPPLTVTGTPRKKARIGPKFFQDHLSRKSNREGTSQELEEQTFTREQITSGISTESGDRQTFPVRSRDIRNQSKNKEIKNAVKRTSTKKLKKKKVLHMEGFTLKEQGKNKTGVFRCNKCSKVVAGKFGAMEHKKQHMVVDKKYLKCNSCSHKSQWKSDMRLHLHSHYGESACGFTDLTETSNCSTSHVPILMPVRSESNRKKSTNRRTVTREQITRRTSTESDEREHFSARSRNIRNKSKKKAIKNAVSRTSTKKKKGLHMEGFTLKGQGKNNTGVFRCNKCGKVVAGKFGATEHKKTAYGRRQKLPKV